MKLECKNTNNEITRYLGYLKASQAAEQLHLSIRQVFRLKKALR
jgi:hypothetical protein